MYQIAVIADDFTSVTDCTISFASQGLSTAALLTVPSADLPKAQVIGMNTDSRPLDPREAYRRNLHASQRLKIPGCQFIYKSVDSTLRGNLGSEIDGVMDGLDIPMAFIAPAFPLYGRTTLNGCHYLNGVPLEQSPIAKDPACPAKESSLQKILESQSSRRAACLGLNLVRTSKEVFAQSVKNLFDHGIRLFILDAQTEDDLEQISEHTASFEHCLVVGSTGLARHIASHWCPKTTVNRPTYQKSNRPIIISAASVSPVTNEQISHVLMEGHAERCLISPWKAALEDTEEYFLQGIAILQKGLDLVVQVDSSSQARLTSDTAARQAGYTKAEVSTKIANSMSKLLKRLLDSGLAGGVALTGGDMAQATLQHLDSPGMELLGEVEPGIPAGWIIGSYNYPAVTKAGAFGSPAALCKARQILKTGF